MDKVVDLVYSYICICEIKAIQTTGSYSIAHGQ